MVAVGRSASYPGWAGTSQKRMISYIRGCLVDFRHLRLHVATQIHSHAGLQLSRPSTHVWHGVHACLVGLRDCASQDGGGAGEGVQPHDARTMVSVLLLAVSRHPHQCAAFGDSMLAKLLQCDDYIVD